MSLKIWMEIQERIFAGPKYRDKASDLVYLSDRLKRQLKPYFGLRLMIPTKSTLFLTLTVRYKHRDVYLVSELLELQTDD
jgi:hypothetical protein